jgi:hypothetical protein
MHPFHYICFDFKTTQADPQHDPALLVWSTRSRITQIIEHWLAERIRLVVLNFEFVVRKRRPFGVKIRLKVFLDLVLASQIGDALAIHLLPP